MREVFVWMEVATALTLAFLGTASTWPTPTSGMEFLADLRRRKFLLRRRAP
jgi:hypothetical protein